VDLLFEFKKEGERLMAGFVGGRPSSKFLEEGINLIKETVDNLPSNKELFDLHFKDDKYPHLNSLLLVAEFPKDKEPHAGIINHGFSYEEVVRCVNWFKKKYSEQIYSKDELENIANSFNLILSTFCEHCRPDISENKFKSILRNISENNYENSDYLEGIRIAKNLGLIKDSEEILNYKFKIKNYANTISITFIKNEKHAFMLMLVSDNELVEMIKKEVLPIRNQSTAWLKSNTEMFTNRYEDLVEKNIFEIIESKEIGQTLFLFKNQKWHAEIKEKIAVKLADQQSQNDEISSPKKMIKENKMEMTLDKFNSYTSFLQALLWYYNSEQLSTLKDRDKKQQLEFKMLSISYFLSTLKNVDTKRFHEYSNYAVESLVNSVNDATYGEPINAYSDFYMGKEYFIEKLDYYLEDLIKLNTYTSYYPKFSYQSIIKKPLNNTSGHFFNSFDLEEYPSDFKENLMLVTKFFDYLLNNPEDYIEQFNRIKNEIKLSIIDPNRNKLIAAEMIKFIH
jgi:hypothetical protein